MRNEEFKKREKVRNQDEEFFEKEFRKIIFEDRSLRRIEVE